MESWHQIINTFNEPVHIIEIQYGDECIEEDIERIIKTRLQLEYDRTKAEWRSKESLLELPF